MCCKEGHDVIVRRKTANNLERHGSILFVGTIEKNSPLAQRLPTDQKYACFQVLTAPQRP